MPTKRIPLVGSYINRNVNPTSFTTYDQLFTNCYPEVVKNAITGTTNVYLNKRPGTIVGAALTGVLAPSIIGATPVVWTGNTAASAPVAAAFINTGSNDTSVWDLATDAKIGGDIANTSDCTGLTETTVSGTATLVGNFLDLGTGAVEQWYFPQGGAWTQVTDGDFVAPVGLPAHINGYTFNMLQNGRIENSDLNSVSAYTANNYFTTNAYPDKGVSVARFGDFILGLGESSIEVLRSRGSTTGSPLFREATIPLGCARRSTSGYQPFLAAHGTMYWLATNQEGARIGVYRLNGQSPEKVSNGAIDKLIESFYGFAGSLFLHGMKHVVLVNSSGNFCFCADTGFWWRLTQTGATFISSAIAAPGGVTYLTSGASNTSQEFATVYQDNGSAYTATAQTENVDFGTDKRKFYSKLRMIGDTQASTSNVGVAYRDEDGASFSAARNVDMSLADKSLSGLGAARKRAWKLTHSANTPWRQEAIELDFTVGTS